MTAKPSYREIYGYLPEPCVRLLESGPDGEELMLRVIGRLGGQSVKVPMHLTARCLLVKELGAADADAVWKIWRGGSRGEVTMDVPRMSAHQKKQRRARLLSFLAAGGTVREATRRFSLTERALYYMLQRAEAQGETIDQARPQLDLFPAS